MHSRIRGALMIYEQRTYTLKPGTMPQFLELFEEEIKPVITKYLNLVGFWYTEMGELNQVVRLWAFEDLDQRMKQREQLFSDPTLANVLPKIREIEVYQENKILMPASFSPLK